MAPTHVTRKELPITQLVKRADNPNSMSAREFDLLVDNIQRMGLTDPILVWRSPTEKDQYEIIGGHHRFDACLYLGFETVFCTIVEDPQFDQEEADFQLVRMNMIRGKLDPSRFFELYQKYASKYGDAVLQDSFGFADEAEWNRLVKVLAKQLPDKLTQDKFKDAAKEIKTIDGLSELLNKMFTMYGNTMPYGYMIVDYGGEKSIWLRATSKTYKSVEALGHLCIESDVTLDDVIGNAVQHLMTEAGAADLKAIIEKSPKIELPNSLVGIPTHKKLEDMKEKPNG